MIALGLAREDLQVAGYGDFMRRRFSRRPCRSIMMNWSAVDLVEPCYALPTSFQIRITAKFAESAEQRKTRKQRLDIAIEESSPLRSARTPR